MSSPIDSLCGKKFNASIGEPWDFRSDIGHNKLVGIIDVVKIDANGQPMLICSVSPFVLSGVKVSQVVAINRYTSSQDVIALLNAGQPSVMNFIFDPSGATLGVEAVVNRIDRLSAGHFLVGSMSLT